MARGAGHGRRRVAGRSLGGKLAGRVKPGVLRVIVVCVGVGVGVVYLLRS